MRPPHRSGAPHRPAAAWRSALGSSCCRRTARGGACRGRALLLGLLRLLFLLLLLLGLLGLLRLLRLLLPLALLQQALRPELRLHLWLVLELQPLGGQVNLQRGR